MESCLLKFKSCWKMQILLSLYIYSINKSTKEWCMFRFLATYCFSAVKYLHVVTKQNVKCKPAFKMRLCRFNYFLLKKMTQTLTLTLKISTVTRSQIHNVLHAILYKVELVYLNGNNAAEGENNIKYANSYPMN